MNNARCSKGHIVSPASDNCIACQRKPTFIERFMSKVAVLNNGCWEWTGGRTPDGYGRFSQTQTGDLIYAYQVGYELVHGPMPAGLQPDHLCRHKWCVNGEHMEAVTPKENFLRSDHANAIAARTDTCMRGHSLIGSNIWVRANGTRQCKACDAHRRTIRLVGTGR